MHRIILLCLALLILVVYGLYRRDLSRLRANLAEGSVLIATRHGPVEVAVRGEGGPVLILHGAGGGYDQGPLLGQMFGGEGHP